MIFIRHLLLLGASWTASFVSGLCWWKTAPNNYVDALSGSEAIATRGQGSESDKGMTSAEYWTAQIGAQLRGHGTALTQTILGQTLPVMILQNAVIDNAKKAVISHRK